METIPFIVNDNTITMVLAGRPYKADVSHPSYDAIYEGLRSRTATEAELLNLVDIQESINETFRQTGSGNAEIRDGVVYYEGEAVNSRLASRILRLLEEGFSVAPFLRFLDNLMENPSRQSVEELYDFLANTGLPITEDGHFLAYKGLRENFTDCHSGKFDNHPGNVCEIRRNKVDDDRNRTCSYGLHVGAFDYASTFGAETVLVKVNPRDVVSVPLDCGAQKCRTCKYEVLEQYKDASELSDSLYGDQGEHMRVVHVSPSDMGGRSIEEVDFADSVEYYMENYDRDDLENMVVDRCLDDSSWYVEEVGLRFLAEALVRNDEA